MTFHSDIFRDMTYDFSTVGLLTRIWKERFTISIYSAGEYPEVLITAKSVMFDEADIDINDVGIMLKNVLQRDVSVTKDEDRVIISYAYTSPRDYVADLGREMDGISCHDGIKWTTIDMQEHALEIVESLYRMIEFHNENQLEKTPEITKEEFYNIIKG